MLINHRIESQWKAFDSHCIVLWHQSAGHRCGYVSVAPDHALYGLDYGSEIQISKESEESFTKAIVKPETMSMSRMFYLMDPNRKMKLDVIIDVHGGLTFSGDGKLTYPAPIDGWWFGFDCGHSGDGSKYFSESPIRELGYVREQCEYLAKQFSVFESN